MKSLFVLPLCFLFCGSAHAGSVSAKNTLVRGTIVQADDVSVKLTPGENRETILADFVGQEVKRTIYAGQVLSSSTVGAPILVRRNSRVTMIYRYGRLEITAHGRALEEGGIGDVVTIMNLDSRQRVTGIVKREGVVEVSL